MRVHVDVSDVTERFEKVFRNLMDGPVEDSKVDQAVRDHIDAQFEFQGMQLSGSAGTFSGNTVKHDRWKARTGKDTRRMHMTGKLANAASNSKFSRRFDLSSGMTVFLWRWEALGKRKAFDYAEKYQEGLDTRPKGKTNPPGFKKNGRKIVLTKPFLKVLAEAVIVRGAEKMIEREFK